MYYILGQGLAGTCLAYRFLEENIPFRIFDNAFKTSSSIIAAGLWNPIVFRRITKSWMADELIHELDAFYPKIESALNISFYHPMSISRTHSSLHEQNEWFEKMDSAAFKPYLQKGETSDHSTFGSGIVNKTGSINLSVFLSASRTYFTKLGNLIESDLSLPDNVSDLENFSFNGETPKQIVDCRGAAIFDSPWWKYLPFNLSKGEILTIKCDGLHLNKILNFNGIFVLPLGNSTFRVGATFSWDQLDRNPTESAKKELTDKFEKRVSLPYQIIDQQAGIRPSVADRRPLLGVHPDTEKLSIFNGLGTKGVMLAPYFSKSLFNFLVKKIPLSEEVDLLRFNKRYLKSK